MIPGRPPNERGFTRIDLAALALAVCWLGMLALPAAASARAKSLRTRCADNLRTIGMGFRLFAGDHSDRFPMTVSTNRGGSADYLGPLPTSGAEECWRHFWVLSNYLAGPRLLLCPADPGRFAPADFEAMATDTNARNAAISYGIGTEASHRGPTPLMVLGADRSIEGGNPGFVFDGRAIRGNLGTNAGSLATLAWNPTGLHRGAGNASMADGSVRRWGHQGLRDAMANSGDTFNNYLQPGHGPGL